MRTTIAVSAAATAVVLLVGSWWVSRPGDDAFDACRASSVGTGLASIGGPVTLIDEDGAPATEVDVVEKPTLVYFGYTYCPDVCPADNARNAEAIDLLEAAGRDVDMAFISIDPARDTPEQLRDFTEFLHPKAKGYTGTPKQIQEAARTYKAYYKKQTDADPDYYLVDHSTFTYLMFPETGFAEFFKRETTAAEIAETVGCFIDAGAS